jgi:O-acetyl-ADP-ribose deacetylase (regulator of RNase III)
VGVDFEEKFTMQVQIGQTRLQLMQGDLTKVAVDAIVNAANTRLAGGAGVDGAIHRAGGPSIMADTKAKYPQGCPTGQAVISTAGDLPAKFVIHTVGPIWQGGLHQEAVMLAAAYRNSLKVAVEHECQSVAFPAISTGVYGYPQDQAAEVSLKTIVDFLDRENRPSEVKIVLFGDGIYGAFARVLEEMTGAA